MALGFLILGAALFVLGELTRPKPKIENARPTPEGDFSFPTATQGRKIPIIVGTVRLDGPNVVWHGDYRQTAIRQAVKTGSISDFFSSKKQTVGFKYYIGIQFGLCKGTLDSLLKIEIGEKTVYDTPIVGAGSGSINEPDLFGGDSLGQGGVVGDFDFLTGSSTQAVNSYLSTFQQVNGNTPAYRGTACLIFKGGYIGNAASIDPWRFHLRRVPNPLGLASSGLVNGSDANPANLIYEALTDEEWGRGFSTGDINATNFQAVGATLASEGNGFSLVIDSERDVDDYIREIERQIDGYVVLNQSSGKWEINLVRSGDTPILSIDETNIIALENFARGSFESTVNEVRLEFINPDRNWTKDYALAQDLANLRIQGAVVPTTVRFPGVKNKTLANKLVWREQANLGYPLAKATVIVNRELYQANPGLLVNFSWTRLGITNLKMRIQTVDFGEPSTGEAIRVTLVEDVFSLSDPAFADPIDSGWTPTVDELEPFPANEQVIMDAPRALVDRDPDRPGVYPRVFASGRRQGPEVGYKIYGGTSEVGEAYGFMLVGELAASLDPDSEDALIEVVQSPDTLLASMVDASALDVGRELANVFLIGDEFIGVESFSDESPNLGLNDVWRGLLDTTPKTHASGTKVYALHQGSALSDGVLTASTTVKLLPFSASDQVDLSSAIGVVVDFSDPRYVKPYPPSRPAPNGLEYDTTVSIDAVLDGATGDDGQGVAMEFVRRDFRTSDEVTAQTDESTLAFDFPTANTTQYRIEVIGDSVSLYFTDWQTGPSIDLFRTEILRYTNAVVPSEIEVSIETRHTYDGNVVEAVQHLDHAFTPSSAELSGLDPLNALDTNDVSAIHTAADTGTYTVTIARSAFLTSGVVEGRINGGSWATVIATATASGTLPGVTAGDDLEFRHTQTGSGDQTMLRIAGPSSGAQAYAVLYT